MSLDHIRDLCSLAARLHTQGNLPEAANLAEAALRLCQETLSPGHYAWPSALCTAAACHVQMDPVRAKSQLEQATQAARRLEEQDFEHARTVLTHAAQIYAELGDDKTARELSRELIHWTGRALGEDHPRYFAEVARFAAAAGDAQTPSKDRT